MRLLAAAFFAIGLFALPSLSLAQIGPPPTIIAVPSVTSVTNSTGTNVIASSPPSVKGWPVTSCPVTVSFNARVNISNWPHGTVGTTLMYRWTRSDGATGPTITMFNPPASFTVSPSPTMTWLLNASGVYWVSLEFMPPIPGENLNNVTRAPFRLTCNTPTAKGTFQDDASGFNPPLP